MKQLQKFIRPKTLKGIPIIVVFLFLLANLCRVFGEDATQLNDSLSIYSSPSFDGKITYSLSKEKSVFIIKKSSFTQNIGQGFYYWYFVRSQEESGKRGWAFGEFLQTEIPFSSSSKWNLFLPGHDVPSDFSGPWWGAYKKGYDSPTFLQQVNVATVTHESGFGIETMAIVPKRDQCTFLVRNIPKLREGILEEGSFDRLDIPAIASVDDKERGLIKDVASIRYSLKFKKNVFMLDGERNLNGFRIVLYSRKHKRQILFSSNNDIDGSWAIFWFGDIDFDGKPDLLIQATDHYNSNNFMLFLSSYAKRGECVGFFTSFGTMGC